MKQYSHPSRIEIDFHQFKKNITCIRRLAPNSLLCLPVKANGYGHGIVATGKCAEGAGVDYLAVAHLQEGIVLREAGIKIPILVLGAFEKEHIPGFCAYDLEFSLSSLSQAEWIVSAKKRCRVHIEVETGMQRTGMPPEAARELFQSLQGSRFIEVVGIYTHFARANRSDCPFTCKQLELFQHLLSDPIFQKTSLIRHCANSGGVAFFPEAHLDMVRPGILCYGYSIPKGEAFQEISPFLSLKSRVVFSKMVESGVGIGYGHTYTTQKKSRIVTIPVGYGDGYVRALSNKGHVLILGKRFPIVGTICMDQCMIDVGDCPIDVGEEVVLIGKQGEEEIRLEEISTLCGTIPYETLTLFTSRLPRFQSPLDS